MPACPLATASRPSCASCAPAPARTSSASWGLAALTRIVRKWLLFSDRDLLPVTLGAVAAHRRCYDASPWLLLVAPSSGTKTEIVRMTEALSGVYPLSKLTARTLASGLDKNGSDPSLLARLTDEVLVVKDLTTVLELRPDERQVIFAQLREVFDGRYDESWGTGKELHWRGRLGFLAGVTPIIDQHHHAMAILGPRFLLFRTKSPDREEAADRAMRNNGREVEMRAELAGATAAFLASLEGRPLPEVPDDARWWLAKVAAFVTRARSPVLRDGYKRELDYAPEPELPMRFAKQLHNLAQGIALVSGRPAVTPKDLRRVGRVALDCLPAIRRTVLLTLSGLEGQPSTGQVAQAAQCASGTVRRALEDLQALRLVICIKATKQGQADRWTPTADCRAALAVLDYPGGSVPEKPREPSHTQSDEPATLWDAAPADGASHERETNCWQCRRELATGDDAPCGMCGWLVCPCGACEEGCDGEADRRAGAEASLDEAEMGEPAQEPDWLRDADYVSRRNWYREHPGGDAA